MTFDYSGDLSALLAALTPYEIAESEGLGALDYAALAKLWETWCELDFSALKSGSRAAVEE